MYPRNEATFSRTQRLRLTVRGAVQGIGFRPFVYRLAHDLGLHGWVRNSTLGVVIEVEGATDTLEAFRLRLERERPPRAFIQSCEASYLDAIGPAPVEGATFRILESDATGERRALVLPDIATCPECRNDILDPGNRRYRYPFTNCTNCGPRFTIIEGLPYDRPLTSMKIFPMCPACRAEYEDPRDRRFHAQPNACPTCGPQLALWDGDGRALAERGAALERASEAVRGGAIVALKGLGGFHLVCDARVGPAVRELRRRKSREEKPLACMFPSLASVREVGVVSNAEERLLVSPEAPIVLLRRRSDTAAAGALDPGIAPGNPYLGVMLPYTPLHHLLLAALDFPIVATSGNRSDETICIDEREALERLSGIADIFLVHDRPIVRHADDSIVRLCAGRELVLRRARGFAPLPVPLPPPSNARRSADRPDDSAAPRILAVGAFLKNTVAVASRDEAFVGQHIGDLETIQARAAFGRAIEDLERLFEIRPEIVACDLHPDYPSTAFARSRGLPVVAVQHHAAHAFACMAENELAPPVLAVSWDGTGYGPDGTVWGGEFLRVTDDGWERVAHLRPFRLPGGDAAVREPRRSALGLLWEMLGEAALTREDLAPVRAFTPAERAGLASMLRRGVQAPATSSAGRLFDVIAALLDVRQITRFEGQSAMELEFAATGSEARGAYPMALREGAPAADGAAGSGCRIVDWEPLVRAVLDELHAGVPPADIARRFHHALVEAIVAVARAVALPRLVLTGGCFQNVLLSELTIARLRAEGFTPYWHQRIPPNDGGIALGQVVAARRGGSPTPGHAGCRASPIPGSDPGRPRRA
jgi:hydrogenase maturation protein HypF